ncbi:TMBIM6 [Bugula neritina]|uniref:TMBIM6 n=1 Tax=Bugula neritina TaxID=10212 RepID=A0A7J7J512_BUGNE|nr:TMBIM6 [Bugula neritina]
MCTAVYLLHCWSNCRSLCQRFNGHHAGGWIFDSNNYIGSDFLAESHTSRVKECFKKNWHTHWIGFLTGVSMGPLLQYAAFLDPSLITTAFTGACVIFGSFTLAALFSRDRTWLYLGGTLMTVLGWMTFASLVNIFFRSTILFQAQIYVGLALFCLFVLYDTQMIIEKRRMGDDDYIWHSVDLFLDFVHIFRKLLIILSQKEEDKKKRRN